MPSKHCISKVYFVIGMHRSGTSALARILNLAGLNQFQNLLDANTHNKSGYWEPKEVVKYNDYLLRTHGSHWADPNPLTIDLKNNDFEKIVNDISEIIKNEFDSVNHIVLKDPRISRIVPVWFEAIRSCNAEPIFLIAYRNPLNVYQSLNTRDNMDFEHAINLWQSYILEAESGTRHMRRAFINYDSILDDWYQAIQTAFSVMDLPILPGVRDCRQAIDEFIDKTSCHHSATDSQVCLHPEIPNDTKRTYELLLDANSSFNSDEFDIIRERWKTNASRNNKDSYIERLPSWHYAKSQEYFKQGKKSDAINSVKRAIELGSTASSMHHHYGNLLAGVGRFEDAINAYHRAISHDNSHANYHLAISRILFKVGKNEDAIASVNKALEIKPDMAQAHHHLGNIMANAGELKVAESAQRQAISLDTSNPGFHVGLAHVLTRLNRNTEAITYVRLALELAPEQAQYHHLLGNILFATQQFEDAATEQRLAISSNNSVAGYHTALARALSRQNLITEAINAIKAAIALNPDQAHHHHQLGNLLSSINRLREAELSQLRAISVNDKDTSYYIALSDIRHRLGRTDIAIETIQRAALLSQKQPKVLLRLGNLLAEKCQFRSSITTFEDAIELACKALDLSISDDNKLQQIERIQDNIDVNLFIPILAWHSAKWWSESLQQTQLKKNTSNVNTINWPLGPMPPITSIIPLKKEELLQDQPTISIMIPIYNIKNTDWLFSCIDSILIQDIVPNHKEIVIVDDASDATIRDLVKEKYGDLITYKQNQTNLGIVANHNNCINIAKGKFVHIIHQDDRLEAGFYNAILTPLLKDETLVAAFSNSRIIDANSQSLNALPLLHTTAGTIENWLLKIIQKQRIRFPSIVVRRSAYYSCGGFSSQLSYAFDWEMWAKLAKLGNVWYTPQPLANYRVHKQSVTNSISVLGQLIDCFQAVALMLPLAPKNKREDIRQQALYFLLSNAWHEAKSLDVKSNTYKELTKFLLQPWKLSNEKERIVNIIKQAT